MSSKFGNSRKNEFLSTVVTVSLDSDKCDLNRRCKFNFSYFDVQPAGQSFDEWGKDRLAKLLEKLRDYGREPLSYWEKTSIGKHGRVLSIYGGFPPRSDFKLPKHVPHQARWGRFRLDWSGRLIGFVVPKEYGLKERSPDGFYFDCNTFYVVFLDENHCFYKTEDK